MVQTVAVAAVGLVLLVALLIVLAVRGAARRAGFTASDVKAVTLRAAVLFPMWLGVTTVVAASGVLLKFDARPPPLMLLVAGSLVFFTLMTRGPTVRRLLDAAPHWWAIAIHSMRVPVELGLWSLFVAGRMPMHLTFEGRNFDVLVGITAPFVALGLARGYLGRRAALVWNIGSLALLANIVGMAITTVPGPLRLAWPGAPTTIPVEWPFVWLPTFLVPVALFGHILSLRQLLVARGGDRERSGRPSVVGPI
jgi:hypothetical protein